MIKEYFLWLFKFVTKIALLLIFIPALVAGVMYALNDKGATVSAKANTEKVGVVELTGVIMDSKDTITQLKEFMADTTIKSVVLRIDSPGGAVGPSQEINDTVAALKTTKPIVVSMGSVAASGGLYSAVSASKIYALPGTLTGSIGVIMEFPNVKQISETVGVHMTTLKSGLLKDVGNPFRDLEPQEQAYLQEKLDKTHEQFIEAVATGRGLDKEVVRPFADGRIVLGSEAKELKLIDELGGIDAAAQDSLILAGVTDKQPELVYKKDPIKELKDFVGTKLGVGFATSMLTPKFQYLAYFGN